MNYIYNILDIALLSLMIYWLINLVRGTRAAQVIFGIVILGIISLSVNLLKLEVSGWILNNFWKAGLVIIAVIFQPEIRAALARLGSHRLSRIFMKDELIVTEGIINACMECSKKKIGLLVVIENETGLKEFIETGTVIDGKVSSELILSIFNPKSPLHDGAIIIQGNKIVASACLLPLSDNPDISKVLGTRHRAAVGISEVSDAFVIVVSEETGTISICRNGNIERNITRESLRNMLNELYNIQKDFVK